MADRNDDRRIHTFFTDSQRGWRSGREAIGHSHRGVFVLLGLLLVGIEITNIAISIVTLLMVFVLQNTQNRDSAALHLRLDEVVRVRPEARDEVQGIESRTEERSESLLHPRRPEPAVTGTRT